MRSVAALALAVLAVQAPAAAHAARKRPRRPGRPAIVAPAHVRKTAGLVPSGPVVMVYAPTGQGVRPAPPDLLRDRIVGEVRAVAGKLGVPAPPRTRGWNGR